MKNSDVGKTPLSLVIKKVQGYPLAVSGKNRHIMWSKLLTVQLTLYIEAFFTAASLMLKGADLEDTIVFFQRL